MGNNGNIIIMDHPLIKHKISLLRDKNTGTGEFRSLVQEIAMLMAFESLRSLPTTDVEIETPIEKCMTPVLSGKKIAVVPILRAGLGMVEGMLELIPAAKVGHIGLYLGKTFDSRHKSRFAFLHGSALWMVYAFLMGWLIGKVSIQEDNIFYAVLMHIGFNLLSSMLWFIYLFRPGTQEALAANKPMLLFLGILGVSVALLIAKAYKMERQSLFITRFFRGEI